MAIAVVIPRGISYYVQDEHGRVLTILPGGSGSQLVGYTSTTVSIKRGISIYIFNEKGTVISIAPA